MAVPALLHTAFDDPGTEGTSGRDRLDAGGRGGLLIT